MVKLIVLVGVLVAGTALADDAGPLAPTNAVVVETEVGSTASVAAKLQVTLQITVAKNSRRAVVRLRETGTFGAPLEMPVDVAGRLAPLLDLAADETGAFRREEGKFSVSTTDLNNQRVVVLTMRDGMINEAVYVTPDNAFTLSRMLRRAGQVQKWLEPRIVDLDPAATTGTAGR